MPSVQTLEPMGHILIQTASQNTFFIILKAGWWNCSAGREWLSSCFINLILKSHSKMERSNWLQHCPLTSTTVTQAIYFYVCMLLCVEARSQCIFLDLFCTLVSEAGSPTEPSTRWFARLSGSWTPGTVLSLPLQHWIINTLYLPFFHFFYFTLTYCWRAELHATQPAWRLEAMWWRQLSFPPCEPAWPGLATSWQPRLGFF